MLSRSEPVVERSPPSRQSPLPGAQHKLAAAPLRRPCPVLAENRGSGCVRSVTLDTSSLPCAHRDAPWVWRAHTPPRVPLGRPQPPDHQQPPAPHTSLMRGSWLSPVFSELRSHDRISSWTPSCPASLCLPPAVGLHLSHRPLGGIPPQYLVCSPSQGNGFQTQIALLCTPACSSPPTAAHLV